MAGAFSATLPAMSEDLARRVAELEAELRSLREFEHAPYRAVVEDMSELIVRWKPDGTRLFVNDAYCRLFALPRSEAIGTPFWPLISEEDRQRVRHRIASLGPEAPVSSGRHRAVGPAGQVIWMEWVDRALFDAQGTVVELQSVGRDITERVRLEEEARRVENADAVARVSASIAHDLNNLLMVLLAKLDELEGRVGSCTEVETMHQTIDGVVDLVRRLGTIRFGVVLRPQHLDINSRVQRLFGLLTEVSGDRVTLTSQLSSAPCAILGDPTQIDQVLLNLVRNAAEAMPSGGEIKIATRVLTPDDSRSVDVRPERALLEVSDSGRGVSASVLPRLFETAVTTKPSGQGLGLATVKAIVEGHGGTVRVRTSPGGAVFEVELPLVAAG
jgi:PAS domain S-box-containing protein